MPLDPAPKTFDQHWTPGALVSRVHQRVKRGQIPTVPVSQQLLRETVAQSHTNGDKNLEALVDASSSLDDS